MKIIISLSAKLLRIPHRQHKRSTLALYGAALSGRAQRGFMEMIRLDLICGSTEARVQGVEEGNAFFLPSRAPKKAKKRIGGKEILPAAALP